MPPPARRAPRRTNSASASRAAARDTGDASSGRGPRPPERDRVQRTLLLRRNGGSATAATGRLQNNERCDTVITWYSPGEPFVHRLAGLACGADSALSGDRITYVRAAGGRRAELVNTDLSGGDAKLLARFAEAEQELS